MLNQGALANRLKGIEALLALALARSASGAGSGTIASFLWQPGGSPGENVYTTWAALAPVLAATKGEKSVAIDTSIAQAHITAGAYSGITDVTFVCGGSTPILVELFIDNGATFSGCERLVFDGVEVEYQGTAAPFIGLAGSTFFTLVLQNFAQLAQLGGQPVFSLAGSSELIGFVSNASSVQAGALALAAAGATADLFFFNEASLVAGAVTGGVGTLIVSADGSSQPLVSAAQSPAPALSISDPQPTFVFAPGATGALDGNVFTTWAALMAVVALSAGHKIIIVDDTAGAAHATTSGAGTWNIDDCHFIGRNVSTGASTLILDDGCHFVPWSNAWFDSIVVSQVGTTAAVSVPTGTVSNTFIMGAATQLKASAAGVFMAVTGTGIATYWMRDRTCMGDDTVGHNVVTVGATATLVVNCGCSNPFTSSLNNIRAHAIAGTGTWVLNISASARAATQDLAPALTNLADIATEVIYVPLTNGNWNPVPATVQAGLDQLAAPNFVQTAAHSGDATATITATTAAITKAKNGIMKIRAGGCPVPTAAGTLTATLLKGGVAIAGAPIRVITVIAADIGSDMPMELAWNDTAADNAGHTYALAITASAGTVSDGANHMSIVVTED
jgi:hypothetical protein